MTHILYHSAKIKLPTRKALPGTRRNDCQQLLQTRARVKVWKKDTLEKLTFCDWSIILLRANIATRSNSGAASAHPCTEVLQRAQFVRAPLATEQRVLVSQQLVYAI